MLDNLKNLKNMMGLLGNTGELKEKVEQIKADLARKTVEAESGAGAVRVVINGKLEVVELELDRAMIATLAGPSAEGGEADKQMIEDLIAAAVNSGMEKAREMAEQEFMRLGSSLNLPGLDKLFGS